MKSVDVWTKRSEVVERYYRSGLTVKEFCAESGITRKQLYRWRQKVKDETGKGDGNFSLVGFAEPDACSTTLPPDAAVSGCGIAVVVNGVRLELGRGFDGAELMRVVALLERVR